MKGILVGGAVGSLLHTQCILPPILYRWVAIGPGEDWDLSLRRKGCDGLRRAWHIAGYVVPRAACAFSHPTEDGRALAAKYTETSQFLVYG
eukprot:9004713-Pyramimonas_sp.AAC.2